MDWLQGVAHQAVARARTRVSAVSDALQAAGAAAAAGALVAAARSADASALRALLEAECDVDGLDAHSESALHAAARAGHADVAAELCDYGATINLLGGADGRTTPLLLAAASGSLDTLELLLALGASLDAVDAAGRGAAHHAAAAAPPGGLDTLAAVLERKPALAAAADRSGRLPLHCAAAAGRAEACGALVADGAAVDAAAADGATAAADAASAGEPFSLQALLAAAASGTVVDAHGCTLLHRAAAAGGGGGAACVEILLAAGGALEAVDGAGRTPLGVSCSAGTTRSVAALLQAGARYTDAHRAAAAAGGHGAIMNLIEDREMNDEAQTVKKKAATAAHYACSAFFTAYVLPSLLLLLAAVATTTTTTH